MSDFFHIDINCDMGEWSSVAMDQGDPQSMVLKESDAEIMPYISSANIACGAHAGDAVSMEHTIRLAVKHGVAIGAHPGYPDPEGFGRCRTFIARDELYASLVSQVRAIKTMAAHLGTNLSHVKPHGALYNEAASDAQLARLIVRVVKETDPTLVLFGLPGSAMELACNDAGIRFAAEAFADRAYQSDGSLLIRNLPGAVLDNIDEITSRTLAIVNQGVIVTNDGKKLQIMADTICIHGDNPVAPALVKQLANSLTAAGVLIRPPDKK